MLGGGKQILQLLNSSARRLIIFPAESTAFRSVSTVSTGVKGDGSDNEEAVRGAFNNLDISNPTVQKLRDAGIDHLFSVQYKTFSHIKKGRDAIVQARTGTGKTLAFALPLLDVLRGKENETGARKKKWQKKSGRSPTVLVLEPTRELAIQTGNEFEKFKSNNLKVSCFYGGTCYFEQENQVRNGIDILVGTPGRILESVRLGELDLSTLKHVVLDEADRMLDMGFQEDIEEIISQAYTTRSKPQTLLFSATVPPWVNQIVRKYMDKRQKHFDLIGDNVNKSAMTVEHKAIRCRSRSVYVRAEQLEHKAIKRYSMVGQYMERIKCFNNLIQLYGQDGKVIIFTSSKWEADELATGKNLNMEACALHADVMQDERDTILEDFRGGRFNCLVATDVAARGLDIPEIDLVIQTEPPKDIANYIHRSGRTGRAGRNGISVLLYEDGQESAIQAIACHAGITFTGISFTRKSPISFGPRTIGERWQMDEDSRFYLRINHKFDRRFNDQKKKNIVKREEREVTKQRWWLIRR